MKNLIKFISTSSDFSKVSKISDKNVALFYKIASENLIKSPNSVFLENEIMGISDLDFSGIFNTKKITDDILSEYQKHNFNAIYLDFHQQTSAEFVAFFDDFCSENSLKLYVPMEYLYSVKNCILVFDMAISGGNAESILEYAKITHKNLAIKISHQCRKFEIPSESTDGEILPYPIDLGGKNVFFSENLLTNYFTYMKNTDTCIFTIFDDQKSLERKLQLLNSLELNDIFMDFPDCEKFGIAP